jgi:polyhydroxyalkanoate synthesis regulator phasin
MSINEDLRKLVLAGLGAASVATEKTSEAIDALSKKGEEVLKQGKDLNERLRHEIQEAIRDEDAPAATRDDVLSALDRMTPEERKAVRDKLDQLGGEPGGDA